MLRQTQEQKLIQKLSPQQIQLMKLLQVPTVHLEERIKDELEINPALDIGKEDNDDPYDIADKNEDSKHEDEIYDEDNIFSEDRIDVSEYLQTEGDANGDYSSNYGDDSDEDHYVIPIKVETTFHDYLNMQLGMLDLSERKKEIATQIIGSIDDDGYLRRDPSSIADDLAFNRNIITDTQEITELINTIQQFDPPGVAARDLRECLLLQLKKSSESEAIKNAINIIENYFTEFTKKHFQKILSKMKITEENFKDSINVIIKLTPKPGSSFASEGKTSNYIIPDFFVYNNNGILELTLNARNAPELRISEGYKEMFQTYASSKKNDKKQKEALLFIKQKIDSAKWFIDAIKQRQHTLLITMNAIMEYQENFFFSGDEGSLRPMILKDIADITGMDISTVSRVANSKYVQTEYGTYSLKYFFSEAIISESGEEVSTREVKRILAELVAAEDKAKPFSDEKLMTMLAKEGYTVARRTVAKYREQLDIPVARLRKQV